MSKDIAEILAPKPEARPRIYAYSIDDKAHKGLLKVGQTTRNVKQRVAEQLKTANIKNYTIDLDESAERDDGTIFSDHEVRAALVRKRFAKYFHFGMPPSIGRPPNMREPKTASESPRRSGLTSSGMIFGSY